MSMSRDPEKWREAQRRGARRYRERVRREVLEGEREWCSIPPVGDRQKREKRHREQFGPADFLGFVHHGGACVVGMGCDGPIEAAHKRSRGAGGKWVRNILRLCRKHHREQHAKGWGAMEKAHGFCALLEAGRLYEGWLEHLAREDG